ncbi:protein FAR1-RELATED SEQUENCE 5-like [Gossypium australe]|uniref:Protein FAR1-RELATED SEQUENCE 5-like n=1 Tax=Gossypium australe TaxID=47621 RepID=A0A5B6VND5_9ROSI|nr:protein FAR1-RELATED SEQUENCE 5-like [Gossypium australe]
MFQMFQIMGQLSGMPAEDLHLHLRLFMEVNDSFKLPRVSKDALRLKLFLYSLRDHARAWLNSLPPGSVSIWKELAKYFLIKYFPPSQQPSQFDIIVCVYCGDGHTFEDFPSNPKSIYYVENQHQNRNGPEVETLIVQSPVPMTPTKVQSQQSSLEESTPMVNVEPTLPPISCPIEVKALPPPYLQTF